MDSQEGEVLKLWELAREKELLTINKTSNVHIT
jgi:hypothetical protein